MLGTAARSGLSDYEKQRLERLERNTAMLMALDLKGQSIIVPERVPVAAKKAAKPKVPKEVPLPKSDASSESGDTEATDGPRRSRRVSKVPERFEALEFSTDGEDEDDEEASAGSKRKRGANKYQVSKKPAKDFHGELPQYPVGSWFSSRVAACNAGVHRRTVHGIAGGKDGAFSIVLSGGYIDDVDLGAAFTYTGSGGRDLKGTKANPKNLRTAVSIHSGRILETASYAFGWLSFLTTRTIVALGDSEGPWFAIFETDRILRRTNRAIRPGPTTILR
jgi:hypothetical protein